MYISISDFYTYINIRFVSVSTLTDLLLSESDLISKPQLETVLKKSFRRVACPRFFQPTKNMSIYCKYAGWKKSELQVGPVNSWMLGEKPWNPTKRSKILHQSPFMGLEKYCSLWKMMAMSTATRPCFGVWPKAEMINIRQAVKNLIHASQTPTDRPSSTYLVKRKEELSTISMIIGIQNGARKIAILPISMNKIYLICTNDYLLQALHSL